MSDALQRYRAFDIENDPEMIAIDVQMDVALEVERLMESEGVTQKELAGKIGVSPARVTQILSGERNLTIKTIVKIATAMGMRPRIDFTAKRKPSSWREAMAKMELRAKSAMTSQEGQPVQSQWAHQQKNRIPFAKSAKTVGAVHA